MVLKRRYKKLKRADVWEQQKHWREYRVQLFKERDDRQNSLQFLPDSQIIPTMQRLRTLRALLRKTWQVLRDLDRIDDFFYEQGVQ